MTKAELKKLEKRLAPIVGAFDTGAQTMPERGIHSKLLDAWLRLQFMIQNC